MDSPSERFLRASYHGDDVVAAETQDFADLQHLAAERETRQTIQKGIQAGLVAGLFVMTGGIVAGPVGAVAGGAFSSAMVSHLSRDVFSLNQLLEQTPPERRRDILQMFRRSFQEEFNEAIQNNPELKLLTDGATILGIMRYAVDMQLFKNDQLQRVDGILCKLYKIQVYSMA